MKQKLQICSSVMPLDGDQQWVQLFPAGHIKAFDGREFNLKNPEQVIAASKRPIVELMIDREHGKDLLPNGTAVPAAGWIKQLEARGGEIWACVEWTGPAKEQLKAREYRYISPVFFSTKDGDITKILRASLVNSPAFEMKAVASSQIETLSHKPTTGETKMDPSLLAIAAVLGMDASSDPGSIIEAVASLKTTLVSVAQALSLAASSEPEAIIASARDAKKVDLAKYVPIETVTQLQTQVASLQADSNTNKATAAVDAAVKSGKLLPAMKEWGLSLASSNMKAFEDFVAKSPVIITSGEGGARIKPETAGATTDTQELEIAALVGVSADAYKATKAKYPSNQ